jgi:hypothetical protein
MKISGKIILPVVLALCLACEDKGLNIKCPDCLEEEPSEGYLKVKLDDASFGYQTLINVYEGNLEDSIIYRSVETPDNEIPIPVTLNKKYTVTATYYFIDDIYITIDSATPRVGFDDTKCDGPCYFIYNKDVDLRLKYNK